MFDDPRNSTGDLGSDCGTRFAAQMFVVAVFGDGACLESCWSLTSIVKMLIVLYQHVSFVFNASNILFAFQLFF